MRSKREGFASGKGRSGKVGEAQSYLFDAQNLLTSPSSGLKRNMRKTI